MAIPPFPSQDLAKLVLGYLAEEQLMTAYDEFLQASPYLDAMRNEYDRIFMTSLKSILAEYRAVKIYVETCKPFLLRKKLFQCSNLLETVRFLVNHIDVNKLSIPEVGNEISSEKNHTSNMLKLSECEVCNSLKLSSCICKSKHSQQKAPNTPLPMIYQDDISLVNSVETTSLADLPGSHIKNRKKHKVLDKCGTLTHSYNCSVSSDHSLKQSSDIISGCNKCETNVPITENIQKPLQMNVEFNTVESGSHVTQPKLKTDESNNVLGTINKKYVNNDKKEKIHKHSNKKGSIPASFQDFASGVVRNDTAILNSENQIGITVDSNNPGYINLQPCEKNKKFDNIIQPNNRPPMYLRIEAVSSKAVSMNNEIMDTINPNPYMKIRPADQKVKILSDVKVDNVYDKKKSALPKNATSTPLMKVQTIVINGTPAYRTQSLQGHQQIFTKDEVMAMPTFIVVPSSGGQQVVPQTLPVSSVITNTTTTQNHTADKKLSPLIIDVSSPIQDVNTSESNHGKELSKTSNDIGLVKTVDIVSNLKNVTSAPKDTVVSSAETSTPLIVPLTKKSSSTPRRTSHIRVLDFATPRRILQESINEQVADENHHSPLEIIPTEDLTTETHTVNDVLDHENSINKQVNRNGDIVSDKQKEITQKLSVPPRVSWDAKLRNMISSNTEEYYSKGRLDNSSNRANNTRDRVKKKSRKSQKIHNKVIDVDELEQTEKTEVVQIKPTINIIPGIDRSTTSTNDVKKESKDNKNKVIADEHINTPEAEKLTLQNVMGAKLNISELLETPYKQVFYDIQMETPRCLVPDIPGEPVSDIKIMNIPTPRFFDSPKIISATPTYSSWPTDYSSGGSYYKPDDHDFIPSSDLKSDDISTKEDIKHETVKDNANNHKKSSRPVRKCAKNVSYYNISKMKDSDDKVDVTSSCSESTNANSVDSKSVKENSKYSKDKSTSISGTKSERKKSSKKRKSPVKKEIPKTFMKIKPRRVTPVKESLSSRIKKRTPQSSSPKLQKKRTSSKEKNINVTPAVSCVSTKSRRKSSTPRKLHCNKTFTSSSGHHASTDVNKVPDPTEDRTSMNTTQDSGDQFTLRWSDDGSQEVKTLEDKTNTGNDSEDISKIKEYIETTVLYSAKENKNEENKGVFQNDLIKRGFDIETARIIERDLLDTPPRTDTNQTVSEQPTKTGGLSSNNILENTVDTLSNNGNGIQCNDDEDLEEIELSLHECNEETKNFVIMEYNDTKVAPTKPPVMLKDKFSMEVCIDDDLTIRLRATPFSFLYDFNQNDEETGRSDTKETEDAVNSILTIDKLYTPMKGSIRSQVYNIFDSTLTSLDTPLKMNSPDKVVSDVPTNTIVLEDEDETNVNEKGMLHKRKRNRSDCSDDSVKDNKKSKSDAQYLLSSANIQNIDIETVLKKLHGP